MDLPSRVAGPGQERRPVGGCDAWRPRPRRVGPAACRVADGRAGGRAHIRRRGRGCMRCNESGWLPGGTPGAASDAEVGASLAAAVPAGRRSLGQAMMHPMQPAAPGCMRVPAGAMMMQAAQRNQLHHRCTRHRRAVKSQVTAAARRPGRPSAPQGRRHRVLTRTTECCIGCNSAPFQPGRQRVPERMHTVPTFLTHRDVGGPGVLDQDLVQMILVGKRAYRRGMPDEHLRAVAGRAAGANVVDHRPADVFEQRQLHPVAGLGLHHRQPVARPVEIAELKTLDVDAAQPEPGDQQNGSRNPVCRMGCPGRPPAGFWPRRPGPAPTESWPACSTWPPGPPPAPCRRPAHGCRRTAGTTVRRTVCAPPSWPGSV